MMLKSLTRGVWTRPTDKTAVYLEIDPGKRWGVRVTLMEYDAKVEAVDGPRGVWYKGPQRYSTMVYSPNFWERLQGITLEQKILTAVEEKRLVAREENARLAGLQPKSAPLQENLGN